MNSQAEGVVPARWSPAVELREAFWALMKKRIRVSPCHSTRASSIGHDCERYLYYEQTQNELRVLPTLELQAIFELGKEVEIGFLRQLEDMGCEIYQRGRDYEDRRYNITGHMDAKIRLPGWTRALPTEIKGLNPYTAGGVKSLDDIRNNRSAWVRKYYSQLQIYLFLSGEDLGVFALRNKSTGQPEFIDCPIDWEHCEQLIQKAERLKKARADGVEPPRHQTSECNQCAFKHVCLPDIAFGPGVDVLDDPELEALLKRRAELEAAASEYDQVDKELKARLPEKPELIVGDYVVTGKEVERKAFTVKASKFFKREFTRITKGSEQ